MWNREFSSTGLLLLYRRHKQQKSISACNDVIKLHVPIPQYPCQDKFCHLNDVNGSIGSESVRPRTFIAKFNTLNTDSHYRLLSFIHLTQIQWQQNVSSWIFPAYDENWNRGETKFFKVRLELMRTNREGGGRKVASDGVQFKTLIQNGILSDHLNYTS